MHEPNLPILHLGFEGISHGSVNVDEIRKRLPVLPEEKRTNLQKQYHLTPQQAVILVVSL